MPSITDSVEQAKREITEDIASGRVPADVPNFSALHDYVDANEYGGLCDGTIPVSGEAFIDYANTVQDAVDAWLRDGRK